MKKNVPYVIVELHTSLLREASLFMGLGKGQLQKSLSAINLANHFIWTKEFLHIPLFYPWI